MKFLDYKLDCAIRLMEKEIQGIEIKLQEMGAGEFYIWSDSVDIFDWWETEDTPKANELKRKLSDLGVEPQESAECLIFRGNK